MDQKTAQFILIIFNLLAILAVSYAIYDFISVNSAITEGQNQIPFDSGTYYLFLMTLFWLFSVIQMLGKRRQGKPPKYSSLWVVAWFVSMLVLANALPYYIEKRFAQAGYIKHADPSEISRIAKGESNIYIKQ